MIKQTMMTKWAVALTGIFLILLSAGFAYPKSGGAVIIANKSVKTDTLTKEDVKNIFIGKKSVWDNGKPITFATLKSGKTHEHFIRDFTGKTEIQFRTYWKKMVFTGMGAAPETLDSESKMIDYVANTSGAIGYVSSMPEVDTVKIINISK